MGKSFRASVSVGNARGSACQAFDALVGQEPIFPKQVRRHVCGPPNQEMLVGSNIVQAHLNEFRRGRRGALLGPIPVAVQKEISHQV